MEGGVVYEWKPEDYLYQEPKGSNKYCLPFEIISERVMLGAPFMKNHDILFDKNKQEIHFVRSNCSKSFSKDSSIKNESMSNKDSSINNTTNIQPPIPLHTSRKIHEIQG